MDTAYDHDDGLEGGARGHEIVILDVMLPGGSGFELLKSLRQESGVRRSFSSQREARRWTVFWAWRLGRTTISPSLSTRVNWWRAFAPYCGAHRRRSQCRPHPTATKS